LGTARDVLVDLYGGVGLFAGTIGRRFRTVVSVEEHAAASDDAIVNLAHLDDSHVVQEDVDTWRPHARTLRGRDVGVVADPSRRGLGRDGVATIATLAPSVLVLVSCDAASLGRDARLLREAGLVLQSSIVVDLFPQTPHVEVVSRFVPASR
jgi:23S rRNA (uracil1939-C5)-methyltransferase